MDPRLLPLSAHRAESLRLQLLRPHEIAELLQRRSVVYLPVGTLEWHAAHLPIGLDALNAEEICLRSAERSGGVVYPTLYYGTGGTHGSFPWTIVMPSGEEIEALLSQSLSRLAGLGVHLAVIFTGHYADEQVASVERVAREWNAQGQAMKALGLSLAQASGLAIAPDHAGPFETTLLHAHRPERVAIERLGQRGEAGGDPSAAALDPLWGVVGPDPRTFDPRDGPDLLEGCVTWLVGEVDRAERRLGRR